MAILNDADAEEKARLLDLFPVAQLKETWNDIKADDKNELCEAIVEKKPATQISAFVDSTFGMCKQHVYLFTSGQSQLKFPDAVPNGERAKISAQSALYLVRSIAEVVLLDSMTTGTIEFLWPVRIDVHAGKQIAVRFVILKKDIPSYFTQDTLIKDTGVSEETILSSVIADMELAGLDVHDGIKHLWKTKYMDCYFTRFKKARSSATENMNRTEKKGIRENDPELFKVLMNSDMLDSVFVLEKPDGVKKFSVDPSVGKLGFPTYSSKNGAMEDVVKKILQHN